MAFTAGGQAEPLMMAKRDQQYSTNNAERKAHRAKNLDFSYEPSKARMPTSWKLRTDSSRAVRLYHPACLCLTCLCCDIEADFWPVHVASLVSTPPGSCLCSDQEKGLVYVLEAVWAVAVLL